MLTIKPVPEISLADPASESRAPGLLHFGAACKSGSPKFHELLTRCDVARGLEKPVTASDVKPPKTG